MSFVALFAVPADSSLQLEIDHHQQLFRVQEYEIKPLAAFVLSTSLGGQVKEQLKNQHRAALLFSALLCLESWEEKLRVLSRRPPGWRNYLDV